MWQDDFICVRCSHDGSGDTFITTYIRKSVIRGFRPITQAEFERTTLNPIFQTIIVFTDGMQPTFAVESVDNIKSQFAVSSR